MLVLALEAALAELPPEVARCGAADVTYLRDIIGDTAACYAPLARSPRRAKAPPATRHAPLRNPSGDRRQGEGVASRNPDAGTIIRHEPRVHACRKTTGQSAQILHEPVGKTGDVELSTS